MIENQEFDAGIWWAPYTPGELELFRLWFEFLKLTDKNKWSGTVAKYVGDVSCSFDEWWPSHSYLFRPIKPPAIEIVDNENDFQLYNEMASEPDPSLIVVRVLMHSPTKDELEKAFAEILAKYHKPKKPNRPKYVRFGNVFDIQHSPDLPMLRKILAVHRAFSENQKKPKDEQLKLWQLEEKISESTTLILKTGVNAEANWKLDPNEFIDSSKKRKNAVNPLILKRRKSQATTVKKYFYYAEEILENIAIGKFPIYTLR